MNTADKLEESSRDPRLRKTTILSAKELFQWRKKENLPVPQRGGVKDYEPDQSWLQEKRLESFYEEHLNVLSEPRVEKSGNLVKGTWDSDKRLVNIEKTAKFWMKMGFADNHRNYLHPEEALFLMEVNCLEVVQHGVSLSLQEAYSLLLHPLCGITEEEYQVYTHLRRLGFIVLRHAGKLDLTPYEIKIGLYKHSKRKNKKCSKKSETAQNQSPSANKQTNSTQEQVSSSKASAEEQTSKPDSKNCDGNTIHNEHLAREGCGASSSKAIDRDSLHQHAASNSVCETNNFKETTESSVSSQIGNKRAENDAVLVSKTSDTVSDEPPKKKVKLESHCEETDVLSSEKSSTEILDPWSAATQLSLSQKSCASLTKWDFSVIQFPDMGGRDTVLLPIPPTHCLPPNTCVDEEYEDVCMFDVEEYRQQQQRASVPDQEDHHGHLKDLEFSYAAWYKGHSRPVAARNWREWKEEMCQREKSSIHESPVAHLWQGDVTPLVQPQDSQSTAALLDKLSVIQPYKGPFPFKESHEIVKISFDVYLPNTSFRKSNPGPPDHRVCVARGEQPPDLFDVHTSIAHLGDGVPLHWAVVSSGDISFFVFDDRDLQVHPSSLG